MRTNTKTTSTLKTHEGAPAKWIDPKAQLERLISCCLLWEDQFYVDGQEISDSIENALNEYLSQFTLGSSKRGNGADTGPSALEQSILLAIKAREQLHLRHLPLYMMALIAARSSRDRRIKFGIARVIQRADELGEFLSLWAKVTGRHPKNLTRLQGQVKKGLAMAFQKFDGYQLAKYNRKADITLTDVARLVHPKHTDAIGGLIAGTLPTPDTWEVNLSAGGDKKETFERLLREGKLGYLALLRNLRNMVEADVDHSLVEAALRQGKGSHRVLPFRYVAAARAAPSFANAIQDALMAKLGMMPEFDGKTLILVDVSGSMEVGLSRQSDMTRMHAAAALASLWLGQRRVFTFSNNVQEVACYPGLPGVDAIINSQFHSGTYLGRAIEQMNDIEADRLVVVSDEQSHDHVPEPVHEKAYMINIASYRNGVGYGRWTHIDGWSENVFRFMHAVEQG
ncbi:MAG: TROVE domain-containing protein [Anaerolineales bacterium]|jgi:hypothetical protein